MEAARWLRAAYRAPCRRPLPLSRRPSTSPPRRRSQHLRPPWRRQCRNCRRRAGGGQHTGRCAAARSRWTAAQARARRGGGVNTRVRLGAGSAADGGCALAEGSTQGAAPPPAAAEPPPKPEPAAEAESTPSSALAQAAPPMEAASWRTAAHRAPRRPPPLLSCRPSPSPLRRRRKHPRPPWRRQRRP